MNNYKIAVAIPAYNRKDMLTNLLESLPSAWDVSVSDNNSSLRSSNIRLKPNIKIIHCERKIEIFENWNRALLNIPDDCTHVFIPSDDDLYNEQCQSTVEEVLKRSEDSDVYIFGYNIIDEMGNIRRGWVPKKDELCREGSGFKLVKWGVDARMPAILFKVSYLEKIGLFDEHFKLTAADSELVQRAIILGSVHFVPTVIGYYRVWNGSLTFAKQSSVEWFDEIKYWTRKIEKLISQHPKLKNKVNGKEMRDEIIAKNILSAIMALEGKGDKEKIRELLKREGVPKKSKILTKLRLVRKVLKYRNMSKD